MASSRTFARATAGILPRQFERRLKPDAAAPAAGDWAAAEQG